MYVIGLNPAMFVSFNIILWLIKMSDIKNKIIDLFNDIEKKNISYEDLKFILESILDNNVDKNEVYSFLDLLHLSNVSKIISPLL